MSHPDARPVSAAFVAALIAGNLFVIGVVNYFIYWARYAFARDYPEAAATTIPTISGAITKPDIGDPFEFWITVSALLLFFGIGGMVLFWQRAFRDRGARILTLIVLVTQAVSCVGMVLLSRYTFANNHDAHMVGSYMFFIAQTLVILLCFVVARILARSAQYDGLVANRYLHPWANKARIRLGAVIIGMVLVYLVLFIGKDFVPPDWKRPILLAYINLESFCITAYLLFLGLYQIDFWHYLRSRMAG